MLKTNTKKLLSVSRVLNVFFPHVNIENINVQKGIVRGKYLDQSIENLVLYNEPRHPNIKFLGISVENYANVDFSVLQQQCNGCWNSFQNFRNNLNIKITEVQKKVVSNKDNLLGIIDALIEIDHNKYIIDWKSKGIFTDYTKVNYEDSYQEYLDWCNAMSVRSKSYDIFLPERKARYRSYNLGNFRYLLQVTFYWYLLGCPSDYKLLIGYFSADEKYHIFTFSKTKALKIALVLLKYVDSDSTKRSYFSDKINKFNWVSALDWKQVY